MPNDRLTKRTKIPSNQRMVRLDYQTYTDVCLQPHPEFTCPEDHYLVMKAVAELVSQNNKTKDLEAREILKNFGMSSVEAKNFIKAERKYQKNGGELIQ